MKRMTLLTVFLLAATLAAAAPRTMPVAAGDTPPDFSLKDQNGETVKLSASRGERPAVLVFYRGYW